MRACSLVVSICLLAGCRPDIAIDQPAPGAMFGHGDPVEVRVTSSASAVEIDGVEAQESGGAFEATVDAADGLGFVVAEHPGSGAVTVRSWHQGSLAEPAGWSADAIRVRVGGEALCGGEHSVTGLVDGLLTGAELVEYVEDNPMTLAVVGTLTVESAVAPEIQVTLTIDEGVVLLNAQLSDVVAQYSADALLWHSDGDATFETITVSGPVDVDSGGATIGDPTVVASDPVVNDSGNLPTDVYDALVNLLSGAISDAIADATTNAAESVVSELLAQVAPAVGIEFAEPLVQASQLTEVAVGDGGLELIYAASVAAAQPRVASGEQGVLVRSMTAAGAGLGDAVACAGSPLLNPLVFAVWDAGNLDGIAYTKEELEERGLAELEFPYSLLTTATLRLDLPPLLEWVDGEPWLHAGGIEATMEVGDIGTAVARTAALVPVKVVADGETSIRMLPDPTRDVQLLGIGFDQLTDLAKTDSVSQVMLTAVPVVLEDVFGSLPTAAVPSFPIQALDGGEGPTVQVGIEEIVTVEDGWCLRLELLVL